MLIRQRTQAINALRGHLAEFGQIVPQGAANLSKRINNYTEGTEAHTKVGTASGKTASRFIDNLVGSTTIEYESDLRNTVRRDTGYAQVQEQEQEQAAGLVRAGIPVSTVRGVLSDTVEWYAYDAVLAPGNAVRPAPRKHMASSSENRSNASLHPSKAASFDAPSTAP